uniref:von Willebrand factor C and EGF domain-containing protein-like n=1 Tax=Crassostrea virginica TaxID=6565 RepID=A0A8B8C3R2_CRAVI|nr:von Willebrand factor C and EGF domain-containing protein-like [Crassostrea virginica]
MAVLQFTVWALVITFTKGVPWEPATLFSLRCPYGKHYKEIGNQPNCNLLGVDCAEGYFCSGDTQDQNGYCCKTRNPCPSGAPYHVGGDAPPCLSGDFRCPAGFTCVGSAYTSSVCCPATGHIGPYPSNPAVGCVADGRLYQPGEVFYNRAGDRCTCRRTGTASCEQSHDHLPSSSGTGYCSALGRRYYPGQRFVAADGCNECTCLPTGQVDCTSYPCASFATDRRHGTPGQLYCTFETIHYSRGQTFTSSDGCQQCTCGNHGRVSCQARPCNRLPGNIGIPRNLGIQGFHDNTGIQLPLQPRPVTGIDHGHDHGHRH